MNKTIEHEVFRAWITDRALTKGIKVCEVRDCFTTSPKMVEGITDDALTDAYYHKPNWHRTYQEALARAEEMRTKRIASLKREIKKLESLQFSDPTEEQDDET